MDWLDEIKRRVGQVGAVARVLIIATDGPTPRATGTAMLVWRDGQAGRIGRGEAEHRSIEIARDLISQLGEAASQRQARWLRARARFSTGEVLGERTGGTIEVLIEVFGEGECAALASGSGDGDDKHFVGRVLRSGERAVRLGRVVSGLPAVSQVVSQAGWQAVWQGGVDHLAARPHSRLVKSSTAGDDDVVIERLEAPRPPFYVYGTGLVARALVKVLAELPFEVVWIDTAPGHYPVDIPAGVETMASQDVEASARQTRAGAFHAVMTADHDFDLAVCRQILLSGSFHYLGVIGSQLKRERLLQRLALDGIGKAALERLTCPIGLEQIKSKVPSVIAVAIAAQALAALPLEGGEDATF